MENTEVLKEEEIPTVDLTVIPDRILNGKTVVVTGASSGVGRAIAEAFALEGCTLVIAARGKDGLEEVANLCRGLEVPVLAVPTDMSDAEQVKNLAEQALQFNGRIDIWVNNAGVMASGKFDEIPLEIAEQVLKTNLFGYMNGVYAVLPIFKRQSDGILINNVSIGGFMPAPYSAVYSASKFGIRGMMECLQGELSEFPGIHVCNVFPQIQRSTGNMHSAKYSGLDFKIPPFAADPRQTAQEFVKLAKNPQKGKFPDFTSYLLTRAYKMFPSAIINTASAGMRMMMKLKNGEPTDGNILESNHEVTQIYGETILPVVPKKTAMAAVAGLVLGLSFMMATRKK